MRSSGIIEHRAETTHVGGVGSPSELVSADYKNAKLVAIWYRSWPIAFTSWLPLSPVEERELKLLLFFFFLNFNLKFSELRKIYYHYIIL